MGRRKSSIPTPQNPHHLIREVEDSEVKELSIQRNLRQVAVVSPDSTLEEIKAMCSQDHGPGKYRVVPISVHGRLMRGYRGFELRKNDRYLTGNIQMAGPIPDSTSLNFWSEQQKTLREQQQALEEARSRIEEDRERMVSEVLLAKQTTNENEQSRLDAFIQHQATLDARIEERRLELEADHQARERERQTKLELERTKLENKRLELDARIADLTEKKYTLEVEHERRLFELKFEQLKEQNERQRELDRQSIELERKKMEIEAQQRESELHKKYGFSAEAGVPKSILTEAWRRRLDEELPRKSDLERALEKYVNPLLEYMQHRGGLQKSLAGGRDGRVFSREMIPSAAEVSDDEVEVVFSSDDF